MRDKGCGDSITSDSPAMEPDLSRTSPAISFAPPNARTRVGNDTALLPDIDGRGKLARRRKEILAQLFVELQQNGRVTEARKILAKRATSLIIWLEAAESDMTNGKAVDAATFISGVNALRRVLCDAGLVLPANLLLRM